MLQVMKSDQAPTRGGSKTTVFMQALREGATLSSAVARSGISFEHGELLLEHLRRTGLLRVGSASGAASCATGACSPGVDANQLDESQRLHCVGCPISKL